MRYLLRLTHKPVTFPSLNPVLITLEERPKGKYTRLNEAMYYWEDYDQEDLDTPLTIGTLAMQA